MSGSDFGRYGVLRFMRRHEETVVASYPIDQDELTFGCDPSCSVRLYYPTVSPLHAKIIFQERKAFIQVLGLHGLLVNKCPVFPPSTTTHTTVALTNNSELDINKKRFRFEYPPKALRPVLVFTPPPNASKSARKRVLRLSMIQSAQVFTPRPDPDPRVNLRVLQTPIRLNNSSPLKHAHRTPGFDQEEYGTPIRLVEGSRPQVVEEEQDLVILEEVDAPGEEEGEEEEVHPLGIQPGLLVNPIQSPARTQQMGGPPNGAPAFPLPPSYQSQQLQTPRRRSARPSLHRAVLIRSAQRAAMRVEMEREQEQEEREVEEHVMPIDEQMEVDEEDVGGQDAVVEESEEAFHEDGDGDDEDEDEDEDAEPMPRPTTPTFGWRKGLAAFKDSLQSLRSRSKSPEKNEHAERDATEAPTYDDDEPLGQDEGQLEPEEEENPGDVPHGRESEVIGAQGISTPRQFTPQRPQRPLTFMTPQVHKSNVGLSVADRVRGRKSTGGGVGRASLVRTWLVTDADVAIPNADPNSPSENAQPGQRRISASEKQAIQERRRSALAQPDLFFGGSIPGSRRNSLGSVTTPGAKAASNFISPSKTWAAIKEDEEEAETSTLLEKMKEVVEGMQRRRSVHFEAPEEDGEDAGQQDEKPEDDNEGPLPPPADSRCGFPATPKMSDLKHVFSERHAANNVPTSYAGVRELFKAEPAAAASTTNPETPRLDGVREMFFRAREREPSTPLFEGVGEMMATPPGYAVQAQEPAQNDEVEVVEGMTTEAAPAPASTSALKRSRGGKPVVASGGGHASKTTTATKTPAVLRAAREGRATPPDEMADDELTPDLQPPLAKPSKHGAGAPKGSIVRRSTRRAEGESKEVTTAPAARVKPSVSRTRKVVAPPEVTEIPVASEVEAAPAARRSRTTTKSTESATTESEPAESTKPARKTKRAAAKTVAAASASTSTTKPDPEPETPAVPEPEPELEPAKSLRRGGAKKRGQSPAPATIKQRRITTKSTKAGDETTDRAASPEAPPPPPPPAARVRRGKTKPPPAAETEDESTTGAGTLRSNGARGRRTPATTATTATAAGAASNRAVPAAGKVRVAPSATAKGARAAGEKENTPERARVKEEGEGEVPVGLVVKGGGALDRVRKTAVGGPKAQSLSEPEKDGPVVKARAPRTRAASSRK